MLFCRVNRQGAENLTTLARWPPLGPFLSCAPPTAEQGSASVGCAKQIQLSLVRAAPSILSADTAEERALFLNTAKAIEFLCRRLYWHCRTSRLLLEHH